MIRLCKQMKLTSSIQTRYIQNVVSIMLQIYSRQIKAIVFASTMILTLLLCDLDHVVI